MTNRERLQSITDEELVDFLRTIRPFSYLGEIPRYIKIDGRTLPNDKDNLVAWLNSEV